MEIKHICENLTKLCCLCKIVPKDILFIVASFLEIGRVNDSESIDSFNLVDNKSIIFRYSVQNALGTPRPNHSQLRSDLGGIYTHHYRRSDPNGAGINIGCIDQIDPFEYESDLIDMKNK